MTDLERIQRLTWLNAALACCHPGCSVAHVWEYAGRAGITDAAEYIHDGGTISVAVLSLLDAAEREGLL